MEKLIELLKNLEGGKFAVFMQDYPDPDAMGSAMGFSFLAKFCDPLNHCDLFYVGSVSHPQNKTMINLLGIPLKLTSEFQAKDYNKIVFVDISNSNKGNLSFTVEPHIVIDHHRDNPQTEVLYRDIRAVGACSSIITSYIKTHIPTEYLEDPNNNFQNIATALLVGIKTDTNELTSSNVQPLDRESYEFLLRYVDANKLNQIVNFTIPRYLYSIKAEAYKNMVLNHSVAVVGLGLLSSAQRDAMPIVADDLLRMEGIETVVAFAIVKDSLVASVRSSNDGVDVNEFCHQIFGAKFSGGKQGAGGASVPLGLLELQELTPEAKDLVWEAYKTVIQQKVFRVSLSE